MKLIKEHWFLWLIFLLILFLSIKDPSFQQLLEKYTEPRVRSFAVYMLSYGNEVPDSTYEAFLKIEKLISDSQKIITGITFSKTVIGLEGETKICAEFTDYLTAEMLLVQARNLAKDVKLLNIAIEPCK